MNDTEMLDWLAAHCIFPRIYRSPVSVRTLLKRVAIPHHRLKEGLKVMVAGTIKGIYGGNYVEIEIDDHICGMNVCTLRVHHAGVYEA